MILACSIHTIIISLIHNKGCVLCLNKSLFQGCKLVRSEKGDKLTPPPPIYIYIYIYIYTQGWESQGTSRYDIITIQRFCDNLYIARQSYNDTSQYLSNYENKMPVKRLSASFLSLFQVQTVRKQQKKKVL